MRLGAIHVKTTRCMASVKVKRGLKKNNTTAEAALSLKAVIVMKEQTLISTV